VVTEAVKRPATGPSLHLGSRNIPVVLPKLGDPRLRLAVVITSLQVLGQVALGFKVSIAQILLSLVVCAIVEVAIVYRQQRVIMWPASALLTGNSVAFILRVNGTQHGDWWTLRGAGFFVAASLIGLLSKYVIKIGGRHIYNPSNLGLVVVLLGAGAANVFPQYLWWGPMNLPVAMALAVIVAGGLWILRPLKMLPMVAAFLVTFDLLIALLARTGHCFDAVWHAGPVCGTDYWLNICGSPELLVFVFFMISDPRTAPTKAPARIVYGIAIAVLATALITPQPSEFGIKLALLAGLTVVCSFVPLVDALAADKERMSEGIGHVLQAALSTIRPVVNPKSALMFASAAILTVAVPAGVLALASDPLVRAIDLAGSPAVQPTPGVTPTHIPKQ
jgi:Na+-translocating ferredoxin:NAD+ oxidoreductase RnfD subunit